MLFAYLQFKYKMMSEISQVNKHNKLRDTPQNFNLIQVSNPLHETVRNEKLLYVDKYKNGFEWSKM